MKLFFIPFMLLLLISCETKKSVVNNYYNDGIYNNESYVPNVETTPEENKRLSYYQPQSNPRKPQKNNSSIMGGGTTINNFYNYSNFPNTRLYYRRFNVYYPWRRPVLYSWKFHYFRWESGFFQYRPFIWCGNLQRMNSYNLGYIHGLNNSHVYNNFHSINISLVSPLPLRDRTGSYGSRGYKTTQRYNRSSKTSFNSRMGGRTFQRKKFRSNRKTPISRFSDNTNRNETSTSGKSYFDSFQRPTEDFQRISSNENWKPKTKRRSRRTQKDIRPNVRPNLKRTSKPKRIKFRRKDSPKTRIKVNRNRTTKNRIPSREVSPNRSSIRRSGNRKTIRRRSRASRRK